MTLDSSLILGIAQAILLMIIGALINRVFERRVRLVAYYGHVGMFRVDPSPTAPPGTVGMTIHTHTVVLRNAGGLPAHNVRVGHRGNLASANIHFSVEPPVQYTTRSLPRGEDEIVFPVVAPREQLTISYLYFPPITWGQINSRIIGDEGVAKVVEVFPTPQWPRWLLAILWGLIAVGFGAVIYLLIEVGRWALA